MNSSRNHTHVLERFALALGLNIRDMDLDCKSWEVVINNEYSIVFEFNDDFIFYILSIQVEPILLTEKIMKISSLVNSGDLELSNKFERVCKLGELNIILVLKDEIDNLSSRHIGDTLSSLGNLFYQVREI